MFFAEYEGPNKRNRDYEKLAIFGEVRQRRGAELKVYSAVEAKCPGFFKEHEDEILDRILRLGSEKWRSPARCRPVGC